MKTLANCTPKELAVQMCKLTNRIKSYKDGIDKIEKIISMDDDGKPILDKNGNKIEKTDILGVISYICDENVDETMALCGEMCFMSGEEFANLNPENGDPDGLVEIMNILNTPRCITFFTTTLKLKSYFSRL